ncbi:MAG TPA: nuclear transport factor 2 family protein [Thermohalobaculum sp.]|nr:nuclear transport factor 2 family protein [Thermohalobaculum sp.]
MTEDTARLALLRDFAEASNRHDADAILAAMTPDCVFAQFAGSDEGGLRFEGQTAVRSAIEELFATFPDAQWRDPVHFVAGDRGLSQWLYTATGPDGAVAARGCDVFTFRGGLIAVKDSYRKQQV